MKARLPRITAKRASLSIGSLYSVYKFYSVYESESIWFLIANNGDVLLNPRPESIPDINVRFSKIDISELPDSIRRLATLINE